MIYGGNCAGATQLGFVMFTVRFFKEFDALRIDWMSLHIRGKSCGLSSTC